MRIRKKSKFIWRTNDGRDLALEDISDRHLTNILKKLLKIGKDIPTPLIKEYKKRKLLPEFEVLSKSIPKNPTYDDLLKRLVELERKVSFLEKMQEV